MLHKIGVLVMLGVFSFYITPRDFLHHFAGHTDTSDEVHMAQNEYKGTMVAEQHRHCEWLHWEVDLYLSSHITILESAYIQFNTAEPVLPAYVTAAYKHFFSLRGPPVCTTVV